MLTGEPNFTQYATSVRGFWPRYLNPYRSHLFVFLVTILVLSPKLALSQSYGQRGVAYRDAFAAIFGLNYMRINLGHNFSSESLVLQPVFVIENDAAFYSDVFLSDVNRLLFRYANSGVASENYFLSNGRHSGVDALRHFTKEPNARGFVLTFRGNQFSDVSYTGHLSPLAEVKMLKPAPKAWGISPAPLLTDDGVAFYEVGEASTFGPAHPVQRSMRFFQYMRENSPQLLTPKQTYLQAPLLASQTNQIKRTYFAAPEVNVDLQDRLKSSVIIASPQAAPEFTMQVNTGNLPPIRPSRTAPRLLAVGLRAANTLAKNPVIPLSIGGMGLRMLNDGAYKTVKDLAYGTVATGFGYSVYRGATSLAMKSGIPALARVGLSTRAAAGFVGRTIIRRIALPVSAADIGYQTGTLVNRRMGVENRRFISSMMGYYFGDPNDAFDSNLYTDSVNDLGY